MLKRQMFGRARLALLSHGFVRAPAPGQEWTQRPLKLPEADAGAVASPHCTTSGQELLCGIGFLAMLSGNAGEDQYTIVAHHRW
jgi:hypothetical protein